MGSAAGQHWSPLQKAVPIIVGVTTFLVLVSVFLLCRAKIISRIQQWFRRRNLPEQPYNISDEIGAKDWIIDPDGSIEDGYVPVSQHPSPSRRASPVERSYWSNDSIPVIPTRLTLSSLIIPNGLSSNINSDSWHLPDMRISERMQSLQSSIPWANPPMIRHVPHTRRFRVSDWDRNTDSSTPISAPSNFGSSSKSHKTTTENGLGSRTHGTIYEDDELDPGSDIHGGLARPDDECANLLSNDELASRVILISRNDRDFTLNSHSTSQSEESNIPVSFLHR